MRKHKNPYRDPIANYTEWVDNRHNPGYYLGGNLKPHLRKGALGPRARRKAGPLLGIMAVMTIAAAIASFDPNEKLGSIACATARTSGHDSGNPYVPILDDEEVNDVQVGLQQPTYPVEDSSDH